jgi:predicted Na+-dependent transporter
MSGIMIAIFLGLTIPNAGVSAGDNKFFQTWSIPTIFFINGVKIKAEEAKKAVKNVRALAWGSVCILLLTAVIGCYLSKVTILLRYFRVVDFLTNLDACSWLLSVWPSS